MVRNLIIVSILLSSTFAHATPWYLCFFGCPADEPSEVETAPVPIAETARPTPFAEKNHAPTIARIVLEPAVRGPDEKVKRIRFPDGQVVEYQYSQSKPYTLLSRKLTNFRIFDRKETTLSKSDPYFDQSLIREGNARISEITRGFGTLSEIIKSQLYNDPAKQLEVAETYEKRAHDSLGHYVMQLFESSVEHEDKQFINNLAGDLLSARKTALENNFDSLSVEEKVDRYLGLVRFYRSLHGTLYLFQAKVTSRGVHLDGHFDRVRGWIKAINTCNPGLANDLRAVVTPQNTTFSDDILFYGRETKRRNHGVSEPFAFTFSFGWYRNPSSVDYVSLMTLGAVTLLPWDQARKSVAESKKADPVLPRELFSNVFPWEVAMLTHEYGHFLERRLSPNINPTFSDIGLVELLGLDPNDPILNQLMGLGQTYSEISETYADWYFIDALAPCM